KEFQPAAPKEAEQDTIDKQATTEPTTELSEKAAAKPPKDQLNVKDLALTKDAVDVDYKALVKQLGFKSKGNVKSVCAELSANLKAQGWTKEGSDLITPASAILKRKRGDAELTIFVKPESGGSEVKMMTEGLAWDEKYPLRHCFGNVITSSLRGSSLWWGPARADPICAVPPVAISSNGLVIVPVVVNDENTKGTPFEAKGNGPSSIPKCRCGASEFPLLPN